jgi:hypothetical protein
VVNVRENSTSSVQGSLKEHGERNHKVKKKSGSVHIVERAEFEGIVPAVLKRKVYLRT